MRLTTRALALLISPVLASLAQGGDGAPSMSHSAPFLGQTLRLEIQGAAPLQAVRLLASPEAGSVGTPFGTLELERAQIKVVALGSTDANGVFVAELPIPSDAAFAEEERHYQALVADPSLPAGAALTEAVHLRVLGTRIYVGFAGRAGQGAPPGGLAIVSAVRDEVVATVEVGVPFAGSAPLGDRSILFTENYSRGAFMSSSSELVLFDPFFGGVIQTVRFRDASRTLLVDGAGNLFVLETGYPDMRARVHVLDFVSGDKLSMVKLPHRAGGLWAAGDDGMAYIAEYQDGPQRTFIRRFGLSDLAEHGAFPVGQTRTDVITDLELADGQLFVGSHASVGLVERAELSRFDLSSFPPAVHFEGFLSKSGPSKLTAVPAANLLLLSVTEAFFPGGYLWAERLSQASSVLSLPLPGTPTAIRDMVARDLNVWALIYYLDGDSPEQLYFLDTTTQAWTQVSYLPCFDGGVNLGLVRDLFTDQVAFTVGECPTFDESTLVLHNLADGAQTTFLLGAAVDSLRVVQVP